MEIIKSILVMSYGWAILSVVGVIIYLDIKYKRVVQSEGYEVGIFLLITIQKLAAMLLILATIHYVFILEEYLLTFFMCVVFIGYKFFDDAYIGKIVIREGLLDEDDEKDK